ncbi:helix-turn-helix domain-containing protein [Streptomyces sp. PKU-MA01144]|uniref:helix-turn-helix domain-containing protein n=1 Tax=Streptomyces sp. PKU-MA01144 TaxID=2729138 RepID=UPI0014819A7E|nr:helix-turn-helix domain-containing protein [Streptomyces sp. PKU-MA01144]NNJ03726.1 helix-turn-helix domain-containing protein [Streptomyces sp. PKU-MA01144]
MTKSTADSTEAAAPPLPSPKERRRLREAKALSEAQLAEALGVTRATVRAWETGRADPRGRKREAYAKLLAAYDAELSSRESEAEEAEDDGGLPPHEPEHAGGAERTDRSEQAGEAGHPGGRRSGSLPSPPEHRPGAGGRAGRPERTGNAATGRAARGTTGGPSTGSPADRSPAGEPATGGPSGGPTAAAAAAGGPVAVGTAAGYRKAGTSRPGSPAPPPPLEPPRPYPGTPLTRGTDERHRHRDRDRREDHHQEQAGERRGGQPRRQRGESGDARPPARDGAALTAEQAFDELYARTAAGLARQTLLLTGRESLSREAVERAFHLAWQRWPEVAVDRDPAGWARAAAYEYALSPWHRLRRVHRRPDPVASARPASAAYPGGRTLREALLGLPPSYRRTLLLYDGLGLDLPDTAAETEASTPAAANRLLNARAAVAEQIPELAEPDALQHELSDLVENLATPRLSPAHSVRGGSERRAELWTRAAIGLTVLILGAAAVTMAVTEDHYEPPQAPGEQVGGVPPRYGPEPYSKEDHRLRVQLHSHPGAGPARLVPLAR